MRSPGAGWIFGLGMRLRLEGSVFFFEKKNQKTFATLGRAFPGRQKPKGTKVFCFFFSKKKAF
jgi:hypothetical protein